MCEKMEEGVTVAGIWLPTVKNPKKRQNENIPSFVYEKDTSPYQNLQQLALAVSCYRPVLLQGPVGSGKTSTVEYLAYVTGHTLPHYGEDGSDSTLFLKVQLGEQTDARMLLGGYQCTEIPGQFVWKPGVLTQAVMKGYWLLLEDIDCTSYDVVTVIDNLVKTQSLFVPGFSDYIIPHSQFQLFATQRTRHDSTPGVQTNTLKHWITIKLNPLSHTEIIHIINQKYPKLSLVAGRIASVLDLNYTVDQSNIRVASVRDILKWCNRAHDYFKHGCPESALRIFHDAVDIFCGFMSKDLRFSIAEQIGIKLGIVKTKAYFLNNSYKPSVSITSEKFVAGRSCLKRKQEAVAIMSSSKKNVFSLTTQSCCLIEKISCCLEYNEPVLLVGETGCGKTTVLQYIASILGRTLIVINMNQQSDTADLLGGFKPVTFKWVMKPLCEKFEILFRNSFNTEKNADCLMKFSRLVERQNWDVLMNFIIFVKKRALAHINERLKGCADENVDDESLRTVSKWEKRLKDWQELGKMIEKYSKQRHAAEKSLIFSFIEGSLITAMKKGHWVLLDEINLASSETLDCLSGILEDARGSIALLEKGDSKPVYRDSGFRLFAAMNPATDVGKKQLPTGLRNRFTELFIDELEDPSDLVPLVDTYLIGLNQAQNKLSKIVKFYLKLKKDSRNLLLDGNGRKPHYSLRNLCRALMITARNPCGNFPRSLYEALSVSFLTQLDNNSYQTVNELIVKTVTDSKIEALLRQPIPKPPEGSYINLEGFWLPVGSLKPSSPDNYILTSTVQRHFRDLIKIVSLATGVPILLEGDTSVGKTSLINYLAKRTGNVCSRVNNHEHTDIQEYIGTYVADSQGKLVFKEGILCESMRKGHWLILDELNLAPTEVLEALNRVLDDNRELFIPETQTTIKAHEKFLLFATQNPPGLYGGRKELSRAFRNRFIELQFNQIPPGELVTILEKRCQMPLSYCQKMVNTMTDLQLRRRGNDIFVGKSGFITLRDLFRWGERYQKAKVEAKFHDWDQHLADEGYILLAGRVRLVEESKVIEEVIGKFFKRKTGPENLFSLHENTSLVSRSILQQLIQHSKADEDFKHIVWTYSMRRLAVLVSKALDFSEPVLIVGETGCGKTSVVQLLARLRHQQLYSVNCHMHSESSDFLGGLRPVRNETRSSGKFFEWCDGPLVQAMTSGSFFLADEISLADDSVLERLNSLLEPERTILLAEKGGGLIESENEEYITVADKNFQFIGTMNPGGDYGKKELSPALRNRFTEIWADTTLNKYECYFEIIRHNLKLPSDILPGVSDTMTKFLKWFQETEIGSKITISVRDVLTWVNFMNISGLEWFESCIHGVCLTFLDGLGTGSSFGNDFTFVKNFKGRCVDFLISEMARVDPRIRADEFSREFFKSVGEFTFGEEKVGIHPFYVQKGKWNTDKDNFIFNAPTTFANAKRLLRGLKMNKAILLEGSPGVGKTSLVSSLAKASGYKLTRINLSDQTDISDLFGADLPEEGGTAGHFAWKDGPFLTALKEGQWILLDELNLASQSVLEGLNAVLDHRGSVYIPELNKTFYVSTETRLFGCQNPLKEGGNRRGLPKSFLNRFTQVHVEPLTEHDYVVILNESFPSLSRVKILGEAVINQMIKFNRKICEEIAEGRIGVTGGPWEFNLRDMTRWAEGVVRDLDLSETQPEKKTISDVIFKHMNLLYSGRFRTRKDRDKVNESYVSFFGDRENGSANRKSQVYITENVLVVGENVTNVKKSFFFGDVDEFEMLVNLDNVRHFENESGRREILELCSSYRGKRKLEDLRLLEKQYPILCSLCLCVNMNWLAILVGETGAGKTNSVRSFAALKGENLRIMACNSAMDTTEILGGFEQTDYNRHLDAISEKARILILSSARRHFQKGNALPTINLLKQWVEFRNLPINDDSMTAVTAFESFQVRLSFLERLLKRKDLEHGRDLEKLKEDLLNKVEGLKLSLSTSDCLTFGGKFEWVDSVLVKCLKDGSWLLMEDVNLCSNAVLDRLNCLLEPNGSLTIGERGAGPDGKLITIKPHPNFRLFFTMDPKNGSISRAMRNRGVEIYLLTDKETSDWPKLDLIALLKDAGVDDVETQSALMKIESKSDVQNITTLISNGFWTAQYIRNGFTKAEAFKKSSKLVYKSMDPNLIDEVSMKLFSDKTIDISLARPSLNNFLIDPNYARLKQSIALLHFLEESSDIFNHLFGQHPVFDANLMTSLNILHIYLTSSKGNCVILKDFLPRHVKNNGTLMKFISQIGDVIPETDDEFPWDTRWFDSVSGFFGSLSDEEANRVLVLIIYSSKLLLEENSNDSKDMTVEKYSKAVLEGRVENSFPNQPIISNFNNFLKEFDDLTLNTLKCPSVKIPETEAKWFLNVMKWRFRLGQQGKLILLSGGRKKILNEDTLTLLDVHLSWFLGFVVKAFHEISPAAMTTLPESLRECYSRFWTSCECIASSEISSKLVKISNDFRKCLGHPFPKTLEEEMTAMEISEPILRGHGDLAVLRTILNRLIGYINLEINVLGFESGNSMYLEKLIMLLGWVESHVTDAKSLREILQNFSKSNLKEKQKIASEIMYYSMKILNSDYEFAEDLNETSEKVYMSQVLPFHRPVWTCRAVQIVFKSDEMWSLSSYKKSQNELTNLILTVIPNAVSVLNKVSRKPLMTLQENDKSKLSLEVNKVIKSLKKCLKVESDEVGLGEVLSEMAESSTSGVEKIFYTRLNTIVKAMLKLNFNQESGLEVVGCCWTLLGLLELLVLREGKLDPIRKKIIKAKYAKSEITEMETEIVALKFYSSITGITLGHFYPQNLQKQLQTSKENLLKYSHLEKIQRNPTTFRKISREIENFMITFDELLRYTTTTLEKIFQNGDNKLTKYHYRKGKSMLLRTKKFIDTFENEFLRNFEDLSLPILSSAAQIEHGLNIIMSELLRRPFSEFDEVEISVGELCRFPILPKNEFFPHFQNLNRAAWPREALNEIDNNKLLILFSSCIVKYNEWLFFKDELSYCELMTVFSKVVEFWKKEEEKKKVEELEKESLYKKRGVEKCKTVSEDEELVSEQLKLFPTFEDDYKQDESEKSMVKLGAISDENLSQVCEMHMKIVKEFITTSWTGRRQSSLSPDLLSPLCMRFSLLSHVLPHISFLLNDKTDEQLLPGLLVLLHCKESGSCSGEAALLQEKNTIPDFYHDKNMEEVSKCLEILQGLQARVLELLEEWPDFPALVQIRVLIERILTFSIESPIMRFLTGLELLLQNCQHWESVAHSGVSISEHLIRITNLIIDWRKMELQGWRHCLQAAHERIKAQTYKWWYHFWCLVEEFLTKDDSNLEELLKALYHFIETSPLGEFDTRLEILLSYHYHVLRLPKTKKRDALSIALWNLYAFYQQFKADVAKKLSDDTAPVVKKLREFVGIAKWHDITYWSVKQAIEKSHRALLKFIKEFEVVLNKKVELNVLNPTQNDRKRKKINIDITKYLKNGKQVEESVKNMPEVFPIKNLDKKLEKARKFSNDVILTAEYPNLVLNLEELTESICESTRHFGELDVDRSLPEEKRKAQAKNIVHQKRRALADLFKTLQRIGLSYRAGLGGDPLGILHLCDGPPVSFEVDDRFPTSGTTGEEYYLKSIFRKHVLENSLLTPSKEIGPQVIERLRGFSSHFMTLNKQQKATLTEATASLEQLLNFESKLTSLTKTGKGIPDQTKLSQDIRKFQQTISETCYNLQQFSHILDSWPLTGSTKMKELNFLSGDLTPDIFISSKADEGYVRIRSEFDTVLSRISKLKVALEENFPQEGRYTVKFDKGVCQIDQQSFRFYNSKDLELIESFVREFNTLVEKLTDILGSFQNDSISTQLIMRLPKTFSLSTYEEALIEKKTEFEEVLSKDVGLLIENILLSIQRLVKKHKQQENTTDATMEEFGDLLDNHFDKKLIESLLSDLKDLNMASVNELLLLIFRRLGDYSELSNYSNAPLRILSITVPFVKQYTLLCSYFVSQQSLCYRASNKLSSVLFGTFIQIAQKGYCAPPEYEEEGDGDGDGWNDKEGGGFTGGEGEGQKDVSDRIESEDQLEDARPEGSEKDKEQERDCKEEENGIEMSENFDGKMQDLDKEEEGNEKGEEDEEEEEPDDKEMGETEEGAEKLESEMWSDSDDENENAEKKEEKGKGEQIDQDEYSAKTSNDEQDENGNENKDKKRKEKQKDINEMEEPEDNGDQIDPYHGHHEPEVEPEPLELPDDLQLDDGDVKGDEDGQEENPFDIDAMKEQQPPKEPEEEKMDEDEKETEEMEDDSNEEETENKKDTEEMDVDEKEQEEEEEKEEEGNGNSVERTDEPKTEEQKEEKLNEEFQPSDDKPSEMPAQPAPEIQDKDMSSADQVVGSDKDKQTEGQETAQPSEVESKGIGQAEIEQTKQSHEADMSKKEKLKSGQSQRERERKRERPGKSDEDRCLGDAESRVNKKLKTLDKFEKEKEENGDGNEESDLYQHVSEKIEEATQVLDAATKDQAESQIVPNKEEEEGEEAKEEHDVAMDVDEDDVEVDIDKQKSSETEGVKKSDKNLDNEGEALIEEVKKQVEGEVVPTTNVERGPETTFHTNLLTAEERTAPLPPEQIQSLRLKIQEELSAFKHNEKETTKSLQAWHLLTSVVDGLARDLSEQLRLILEPTQATRLKGDYRTGRRINMRKVISYIASEFRKDSIWLRRTKPWKREHEIILAIDDSSSMCHNESKELAFESLALVFKALGLIEAGQLGVLSFGEKTKIVHRLGDPFTDDTGARILQEFTFEQNKTLVCELLNVSESLMTHQKKKKDVACLLMIISDGRGVFSEGIDAVKAAVRRLVDCGIFIVFIIIDNPKSKESIMDIRVPEFKEGKFLGIQSYMELFPFPYYLILRNISALPNTLGDALRQWFQLITVNKPN